MRRGSSGGVGSGSGVYNKPPPAPMVHNGGGGRARLQASDPNGSICIDRFGSPRERSPILNSTIHVSPSHPASREKSPNPTVQDLHDCSMCLSAYIQSLNTVCGTACRLSQCLSQVASDTATDVSGPQWPFVVKDAADIWEGIARAVGVASAAAKTQIISLLQEALTNQTDYLEPARKHEVAKVIHSVLLTFLNLHYQFSLSVVERFSETLQNLREDTGLINGMTTGSAEPSGCGAESHQSSIIYHPSQMNQMIMQQKQQAAFQQQLNMMAQKMSSSNESILKEENGYGGHLSVGESAWTCNSSPVANSSSQNFANHGRNLSPSFTAAGFLGNEWNTDATIRRWSMGGPTDGWADKTCLTPFNMFANRRWSVPETSEEPHSFSGLHPLYASGSSFTSGQRCKVLGSSRGTRHATSLDSSGRSPLHSRSVTPEQSRQSSATSEELQNVVHLLSLPTFEPRRNSGSASGANVSSEMGDMNYKSASANSSNEECLQKKLKWQDKTLHDQFLSHDDGRGQICTALWPPAGNVPAVTLTECSGEEEQMMQENGVASNGNSFARDSPSRASWPVTSTCRLYSNSNWPDNDSSGANLDSGAQEGGWPPLSSLNFRRHSTDAPFFLPQENNTLTKTKSFENLKKTPSNEVVDSNIQNLIYMGSLMSTAETTSNNSQYTLFSRNT